MAVSSLWQATADPAPSYPALTDEVRADAAIVGGGYTAQRYRADAALMAVLLAQRHGAVT